MKTSTGGQSSMHPLAIMTRLGFTWRKDMIRSW